MLILDEIYRPVKQANYMAWPKMPLMQVGLLEQF